MQKIYICRHGETAWNITKQHTSFTDIPLTENGIKQAISLKDRLKNKKFSAALTSPYKRAKETCELAGFEGTFENSLVEWNYGNFEGMTTKQIQAKIPNWSVFKYGCEGGESIDDVTKRGYNMVEKLLKIKGDVITFTHGHYSRVLIACWLGLTAKEGRYFCSSNTSLSILGYEHNDRVLKLLNDTSHLKRS